MTYKFSIECGPDATDNFNDYTRIHNTYND